MIVHKRLPINVRAHQSLPTYLFLMAGFIFVGLLPSDTLRLSTVECSVDSEAVIEWFKAVESAQNSHIHSLVKRYSQLVHVCNAEGHTALTMAALKGDELCVRALLAAGIDVNQKNKKDETALMNAAFGGHMDVVRALLAAGADPMIKTDSGKTADMLAKNDEIRDVLFAEICTRGSCVGGAGAASGSVANTIDAQAIVELGVLYHAGQGVLRDYGRARELYERAAAQGNADAQNRLGWLYEKGLGVPYQAGRGVLHDYVRARELYEQAAAQGHARAQTNLGLLYQRGLGVPKDYVRAREWYEKAAAQGFAEAQNNLGWLYADQGVLEGILRDYRRAREFFEQAAAQGHAGAQYGLGWSHEFGFGVPHNCGLAREWYEKAAAQGLAEAQFRLGFLYQMAYGGPRNLRRARDLYEQAAAQGHARARRHFREMGCNVCACAIL
jgi:TPR repeat protein